MHIHVKLKTHKKTCEACIPRMPRMPRMQGDIQTVPDNNRPIMLSFCITCMHRESQIQQTLLKNLHDNWLDRHHVEFVLVDFGEGHLASWIRDQVYPNLSSVDKRTYSSYFRYIHSKDLVSWHASKAKNIAHSYARGKYVVNLDGDNFTGYRGGAHIMSILQASKDPDILFHQWSGVYKDGSYGRIVCSKKNFDRLGGYDESLLPMSYQDHDFMMRYKHYFGSRHLVSYTSLMKKTTPQLVRSWISQFSRAVPNTKEDSIANIHPSGLSKKNVQRKMSWEEMNRVNQAYSRHKIENHMLVANQTDT